MPSQMLLRGPFFVVVRDVRLCENMALLCLHRDRLQSVSTAVFAQPAV